MTPCFLRTRSAFTMASGALLAGAATVASVSAPSLAHSPRAPVAAPTLEVLRGDVLPGEAAEALWLDSLDLSFITQGYGKPGRAQSVDSHQLSLGGKTLAHGIGTHANSDFNIDVNGGATRFSALVGVDDETGKRGSVQFQVRVDGRRVAQTPIMKGGDAPRLLTVDIRGAKRLTLRVTDGDDGIDFDHADWGGALLQLVPHSTRLPVAVAASSDVLTGPPPIIFNGTRPQPAIHGPRLIGATPGKPFLFQVPATGQLPLRYSAKNLPKGLTLDAQTGIISGALQNAGNTVVTLQVNNALGKSARKLTVVGGTNRLMLTPPLGWNSWNIYYCGVDEKKVRDAANELVRTGLSRHGFAYVNIDDCWQGERDANGELQVNPKFGDMKLLGDSLHAQGFKFGIYSSPGPKTCAGYAGSYNHEAQDVATYSKWGVDYLKYDWCSYGDVAAQQTEPELEKQIKPYRLMGRALSAAPRDIVYSLCQYGMADVGSWGPSVGANLWRTTGDIQGSYGSMAQIGFSQNANAKYAAPGGWNDPDMLFLHAMAPSEQLSHLSLWSLLAAPLLIGSDLSKVSQFTIDALSNDEVLDVDQDPLGVAGTRRARENESEVWARPLWDGTMAVGLFNRDLDPQTVTARWSDLGLKGALPVRDLWQQRDLGRFKNAFSIVVPAHGAVLLKIGVPKKVDAALVPAPRLAPQFNAPPVRAASQLRNSIHFAPAVTNFRRAPKGDSCS